MPESKDINPMAALLKYDQEGPYLVGGKCGSCHETHFPKQSICPRCTGQDIEEVKLSRRGKLYTFTEVHQKPPDYEGPVPYMVGRVLLPEGVFVLSQLKGKLQDFKMNMEMQLISETIYRDECDKEVKAYLFKPA
jgi:uncharacterized protein